MLLTSGGGNPSGATPGQYQGSTGQQSQMYGTTSGSTGQYGVIGGGGGQGGGGSSKGPPDIIPNFGYQSNLTAEDLDKSYITYGESAFPCAFVHGTD